MRALEACRAEWHEEQARQALKAEQECRGIDWMGWADLAEAIPPAYTEHLGRQLLEQL